MQYQGVLSQLRSAVETLDSADPSSIDSDELSCLLRRLSIIQLRGLDHLDAPDAARVCGTSVRSIRLRRAASRRVGTNPKVTEAVASGRVSLEVGSVLAANPKVAEQLLANAAHKTPEDLRYEIERLQSCPESEAARYRRMWRRRSVRNWVDAEGLTNIMVKLAPDDGAVLLAFIKDRERTLERARGSTPEAHRADALLDLLRNGTGAARTTVNVHVDYESLRKGWAQEDGFCEVAGLGPIPVAKARSCFEDAVIQVLLSSKNLLKWMGRGPVPKSIREAVVAHNKGRCQKCGSPCSQVDHVVARVNGGQNELSNLQGLCDACHGDKTVAEVPYAAKYYKVRWPRAG